ncbi:glyoxalase [Streptomyces sp. AJS327]|uniref:VOC family protein n=1 Tax=Streptomyces sp. AJS327 TaxID=2545265 RepID=UPI0015DDB87C|nr:VOC family protein [Streptomyces sp. AJS327]MBA0053311.1 glyoxalase [Streptomyces sp. AJS327]
MPQQIFVNLPVRDLNRATDFFGALGFEFNEQFTDEKAACMVVSDSIFVMLLVEPYFRSFTKKEVADTERVNEVLVCLSAESRAQVDELAERALAAGGRPSGEPIMDGPMYGRAFLDLDGHQWELMYMDPAALQG